MSEDVKFLNFHDVQLRLANCIGFYKGEPYVIQPVENSTDVKLLGVFRGHEANDLNRVVSANNPDLDVTSPELGWFEFDNNFYYAARTPVRRYKQGIHRDNCLLFTGRDELLAAQPIGTVILSRGFYNMLKNDYQTFDNVVKRIKKISTDFPRRVAFSKKFAIEKMSENMYYLRFGGRRIGTFDNELKFLLNPLSDNSLMRLRLISEGVRFV